MPLRTAIPNSVTNPTMPAMEITGATCRDDDSPKNASVLERGGGDSDTWMAATPPIRASGRLSITQRATRPLPVDACGSGNISTARPRP
ncbi:MAG: hypothetical protein HUU19_07245 [Phycisphaerales bacterium]|nr:hypothetical protein [Phycisphaerales bacterium]